MIRYAFYDFEFGTLKIGYTDDEIIFLKRVEQIDAENKPSELSNLAFEQVCEYFKGKRHDFDFPYKLEGTVFEKKVWNELCQIPYGETRTYKQIAMAVGNPKASRAVGMANNKNPLTIVVPCHRVIGTNGNLIGYAGGLNMKKALLELEQK
jgi:O-6-methylguanine DNA methyltransferase